jgi:hypothetical protein
MTPGRAKFQTELQVRPDDIDMNQHVHSSRYFDYVLAARYDQMSRCYGMGMDEFLKLDFGWVVKDCPPRFQTAAKHRRSNHRHDVDRRDLQGRGESHFRSHAKNHRQTLL